MTITMEKQKERIIERESPQSLNCRPRLIVYTSGNNGQTEEIVDGDVSFHISGKSVDELSENLLRELLTEPKLLYLEDFNVNGRKYSEMNRRVSNRYRVIGQEDIKMAYFNNRACRNPVLSGESIEFSFGDFSEVQVRGSLVMPSYYNKTDNLALIYKPHGFLFREAVQKNPASQGHMPDMLLVNLNNIEGYRLNKTSKTYQKGVSEIIDPIKGLTAIVIGDEVINVQPCSELTFNENGKPIIWTP